MNDTCGTTCRCKTLSDTANGYARAEAVSALILSAQTSVVSDGTTSRGDLRAPLCLVRGSAAGQDGRSSALTAPNGPAQQQVLRAALSNAGLSASEMAVLQARPLISSQMLSLHHITFHHITFLDNIDSSFVATLWPLQSHKRYTCGHTTPCQLSMVGTCWQKLEPLCHPDSWELDMCAEF